MASTNNYFVYAEYCPKTPWLEFRILQMNSDNVIAWKAFIEHNASVDIGIFLGIIKSQQYIKSKYSNTDNITIYCNEALPVEWFSKGKCDHNLEDTLENEFLLEMITSAEKFSKSSECVKVDCWVTKRSV